MLNKAEGLTMAEMQDIVLAGSKLFDATETNLERAYKAAIKLVKTIDDGHAALMVGHLEGNQLRNEARAIAGDLANAAARLYRLHRHCTDIAMKHGVDVPQPRSGGGPR